MSHRSFNVSKRSGSAPLRRGAIAGLLLVIGIFMSACGGGAPTSSTGGEGTLLERVEGKELRMAIFAGPPQAFQSADGSWTGYDVDILTGFAETLKAKPVFVPLPFDGTLEAVQSKRADVSMDIYWNEKRAAAMDFSRPMGNFVDGVAVRASNPLVSEATFEGLKGKSIGVIAGTIYVDEAGKIPGANVVKFSGEPDLLAALKQGRVDATLNSSVAIATWGAKSANDVKFLGRTPSEKPAPIETLRGYFAVAKGTYSDTFREKLNAYIKKMSCDGSLQKIMAKYDITDASFFDGLCEASDVPGLAKS